MIINKLTYLVVSLAGLLFISAAASAGINNSDQKITALLQSTQQFPLQQRIERLSDKFIGVSYQLEPLGEGADGEYSQRPLYWLDSFDCETYVDTILALALSENLQEFQQNINAVRYAAAKVVFQNRNHFTGADWIPNNKANGFIRDITRQIAGDSTQTSRVLVDKKNWYQHLPLQRIHIAGLNKAEKKIKLQKLRALSEIANSKVTEVDYIPLRILFGKDNLAVVSQIPSGAIVFLVRHDPRMKKLIGTDNDISHMGFVIKKQGQLYFREASSYAMRVIDIPLLRYLSFYLPAGELRGISVWEITTPLQSSYSQAELNPSK